MKQDNNYILAINANEDDCVFVGIKRGEEILEYVEVDREGALDIVNAIDEWLDRTKDNNYYSMSTTIQ